MTRIPIWRIGLISFAYPEGSCEAGIGEELAEVEGALVAVCERRENTQIIRPGGMSDFARHARDGRRLAEELISNEVAGIILNVADGCLPEAAVEAAVTFVAKRKGAGRGMPVLLFARLRADRSGLRSGLAVGGELDVLGIPHVRVFSPDVDKDERAAQQLRSFCYVAWRQQNDKPVVDAMVGALQGAELARIGGPGEEIMTGDADLAAWREIFGARCTYIDPDELAARAGQFIKTREGEVAQVEDERIEKAAAYLREHARSVQFGNGFDESALKHQLAFYYGMIDLAEERKLDGFAVDCELPGAKPRVHLCLAQAFLNDLWGPAGEAKRVIPCACGGDLDSALLMLAMHAIARRPVMFSRMQHVAHENPQVWYLVGCRAHTPWYVARRDSPEENLGLVDILPDVKIGAGNLVFTAAAGAVSCAQLRRRSGRYWVNIVTGDFVNEPPAAFRGALNLPRAYFKSYADKGPLLSDSCSSLLAIGAGHKTSQLIEFCQRLGLSYKVQATGREYEQR